jgi:hypothetical protein
MAKTKQRVIVASQRGVGAKYIPIDRYADDITLVVVPNGATYTVDYTLQNILRTIRGDEQESDDLVLAANANWTPLGALTNDALRVKLQAFALRLDVSATTGAAISAAIAEDGGVFTDETDEANSAAADDMTLLPAVPVADVDRYNFGFDSQASSFSLNVGTAGTGTYTIVWEYWNGTAWAALAGVTDGTTDFQTAGLNTVSWTAPTDWTLSTVNGQGPYYYVRAEVQAGTVTLVPIGTQAFDLFAKTTIRIAQG